MSDTELKRVTKTIQTARTPAAPIICASWVAEGHKFHLPVISENLVVSSWNLISLSFLEVQQMSCSFRHCAFSSLSPFCGPHGPIKKLTDEFCLLAFLLPYSSPTTSKAHGSPTNDALMETKHLSLKKAGSPPPFMFLGILMVFWRPQAQCNLNSCISFQGLIVQNSASVKDFKTARIFVTQGTYVIENRKRVFFTVFKYNSC